MIAFFERIPLFLAFVSGAMVARMTFEWSFSYFAWNFLAAAVWVLTEVTYAKVIRRIVRRVAGQYHEAD